jgi:hypothetical protein
MSFSEVGKSVKQKAGDRPKVSGLGLDGDF